METQGLENKTITNICEAVIKTGKIMMRKNIAKRGLVRQEFATVSDEDKYELI